MCEDNIADKIWPPSPVIGHREFTFTGNSSFSARGANRIVRRARPAPSMQRITTNFSTDGISVSGRAPIFIYWPIAVLPPIILWLFGGWESLAFLVSPIVFLLSLIPLILVQLEIPWDSVESILKNDRRKRLTIIYRDSHGVGNNKGQRYEGSASGARRSISLRYASGDYNDVCRLLDEFEYLYSEGPGSISTRFAILRFMVLLLNVLLILCILIVSVLLYTHPL